MSGFVLDVLTPEDEAWLDFKAEEAEDDPGARDEPGPLAEMLSEMCRGHYEPERVMWFADEASHLIGGREGEDGPIVGFLLLSAQADASAEATINLLCVAESAKSKGTGLSKLLLDKAKAIAREAKKKRIGLDAANATVAKLYEANGFRFDTAYKSPYADDTTSHMVYDLTQTASSRLNRKTRRAKRNGRNTKHGKLRKLASRRR
jgi:predicted GNAT family N-acyltransferase